MKNQPNENEKSSLEKEYFEIVNFHHTQITKPQEWKKPDDYFVKFELHQIESKSTTSIDTTLIKDIDA